MSRFNVIRLRRKDLEAMKEKGETCELAVIGLVYADDDVDPELVKATITSTRVYGRILGRKDTQEALLSVSAIR